MNKLDEQKRKDEFKALAKVAEDFINKWGDPHSVIIIEQGGIRFYEGEIGMPLKVLD